MSLLSVAWKTYCRTAMPYNAISVPAFEVSKLVASSTTSLHLRCKALKAGVLIFPSGAHRPGSKRRHCFTAVTFLLHSLLPGRRLVGKFFSWGKREPDTLKRERAGVLCMPCLQFCALCRTRSAQAGTSSQLPYAHFSIAWLKESLGAFSLPPCQPRLLSWFLDMAAGASCQSVQPTFSFLPCLFFSCKKERWTSMSMNPWPTRADPEESEIMHESKRGQKWWKSRHVAAVPARFCRATTSWVPPSSRISFTLCVL